MHAVEKRLWETGMRLTALNVETIKRKDELITSNLGYSKAWLCFYPQANLSHSGSVQFNPYEPFCSRPGGKGGSEDGYTDTTGGGDRNKGVSLVCCFSMSIL